MEAKPEEKSNVILKTAVLSTATIAYFGSITTPVLGEIALEYPDAGEVLIRSVATLPSLMLVIFSFAAEWLCRITSKRNILLLATGFAFAGGVLPAFFGGIYFILATRAVYGIGLGIGYPLSVISVVDFFDGKERIKVMGYNTAAGSFSGILFQILGGITAVYYWRYAFLCYFLAIIIAVLVFIGYPKETGCKSLKPDKISRGGKRLTIHSYLLAFTFFYSSVVMWSFFTKVPIVFAKENIGNSADCAVVLAVYSLMMSLSGLYFNKVIRLLKNYSGVFGALLLGAGYAIIIHAQLYSSFITAAVLIGTGFGIYFSSNQLAIGLSVRKQEYATLAVSLGSCCMGLGQFSSTYILTFITNLMDKSEGRAEWAAVTAMTFLGAMVSAIIITLYNRKKINIK